jgi:hypothetical protein
MDDKDLLDCPMCGFSVVAKDNYVLQLHFEQEHTTDSPFRIHDDPEPLPAPPRPPSPLQFETDVVPDTPASSSQYDKCVLCPQPDCSEVVLLSDFNDHIDYHVAESLSFDNITGKYRSGPSQLSTADKITMYTSKHAVPPTSPRSSTKPSFLHKGGDEDAKRKSKKVKRGRSDTSCSEKSTLSRSILSLNPFAKGDHKVKPPIKNCRLGVRLTRQLSIIAES